MLEDKVYLAVAGAGKTTQIVENILATTIKKRIAVISYANRAVASVTEKIREKNFGVIPSKVDIFTWYSFLYHECVLPYQRIMFVTADIRGMSFEQEQKNTPQYNPFKKTDVRRYITFGDHLKAKETMDFVVECIKKGKNLIGRLSDIYEEIIIDEAQDLAHDDLDFIEYLVDSPIKISLVGDSRQATFTTHNGARYKKYKGANIIDYFKELEKKKKITLVEWNDCKRSNNIICEFADRLFPALSKANSLMTKTTGHDGVFLILEIDIPKYTSFLRNYEGEYEFLGYDKNASKIYRTLNFGECKGLTFDRTILFANKPLLQFVSSFACEKNQAKYYVGITRARYSVAIVVNSFPNSQNYKDMTIGIGKEQFIVKEYNGI